MQTMASEKDQTRLVTPVPNDAASRGNTDDMPTSLQLNNVVGKLTIVDGPGAGKSWEIRHTALAIGRDSSNQIQLNFGDDTVHRKAHGAIVYLKASNEFVLKNIQRRSRVAVNGTDVSDTQAVTFGDLISVGMTTFRLEHP
jgi:hypothetical protein